MLKNKALTAKDFRQATHQLTMDRDIIIDTFFTDQKDYIDFLVSKKRTIIASENGEYFAELKKEEDDLLYTFTFNTNGEYTGDYVKPFNPTLKI